MSLNIYQTFIKNVAVLTAGRLFSRIIQFFLFIYAARTLGVDGFGIFSFAFVLVSMLSEFMDLGISHYSVQQVSRNLEMAPKYVGTSLIAKIFLIALGTILIFSTAFAMGKDALTIKILLILTTMVALDNLSLPFGVVFQSHEKMQYSAAIISICNPIMSIFGFFFLFFFQDILSFCFALAIGAFLRLILGAFWCIKKYGYPSFKIDFLFLRQLIRKSIPFSLASFFITIYYQVDSIMLDMYHGSEIVGYYNAAYRLLEAPLFISASITTVLFPSISRLYAKSSSRLNILLSESLKKGIAFGLSVSCVIAFLSNDLIILIYGKEYEPSARALPILVFSVVLIMVGSICGTMVRASDRQKLFAKVAGGGVVLNITLNLILIPSYSYLGAAWATVITEFVMACIYTILVRQYVTSVFYPKSIAQILIFASLLLVFLAAAPIGLWGQIAGCIILFFPLMWVVGLITTTELQQLFSMRKKL